ncbi:LruC domain-containing protein [Flammeovirga sp. MY04]|uniref:LruC domain-containing protein n=1 Tax=Flammeovirga sp. MY04 TaxID=1191459 RepID=UPI0008061B39|nr:LruC domain-containing protein [Flammeovirga sp. MY04]ANQ49685.1 LruC domain-containing protein [Flammeovirga sp. MY04]
MKKLKFSTLFLSSLLIIGAVSCTETIDGDMPNQNDPTTTASSFEETAIPEGFTFKTSQELTLHADFEGIDEQVLYEYRYVLPSGDVRQVGKMISNAQSNMNHPVRLPIHVKNIQVIARTTTGSYLETTGITGNNVYVTFNSSSPTFTDVTSNQRSSGISSTDTDSDGVIDSNDDYPNDPNKAFDSYYPAYDVKASYAFEDLYPRKGDYDFNDVVIDYNYHFIKNAAGHVVELIIDCNGVQVEAGLVHGAAIETPYPASYITSVTGYYTTNTVVELDSKGIETGNDANNAVVLLFDNMNDRLETTSGDITMTDDIVVTVVLNTPADPGVHWNFNPFIFRTNDRSREVHLSGQDYTAHFDTDLLNRNDADNGFETEDNHPWALDIPEVFEPPLEGRDITNVYHNFQAFAESGGATNTDWYLDIEGYRNQNKIAESVDLE